MAIEERTRPYETLIRHNEDGSIGAHHIKINEVVRDGVVIAASVGAAEPVEGPGLQAVLGEAAQSALLDAERGRARITELQAEVEQAQQAAQSAGDLQKQLGEAQAQLGAAYERIGALQAELETASDMALLRDREILALRKQIENPATTPD